MGAEVLKSAELGLRWRGVPPGPKPKTQNQRNLISRQLPT